MTHPDAGFRLPTASTARTRRATLELLGRHRGSAVAAGVTLLAATIAGLLVPALLGRIVDAVLDAGRATGVRTAAASGAIDTYVLLLLAAVIAEAVFRGAATYLVARSAEHALAGLRETVVDRVLRVPLAEVERSSAGDVLSRVTNDVRSVSQAIEEAIPALVVALLTTGLTVLGLGVLDPRLALAAAVIVPIHVVATRWYLRRSGPLYAAERIALGDRTGRLGESLAGARTVQAFGLQDRHTALVDAASVAAVRASLRARWTGSRFFAVVNGAECVGLTSVLVVGFVLVRGGSISVGEATAAALYFHRLFGPVMTLLGLLDTAQDAAAGLARLVGVADLDVPRPTAAPHPPADTSVQLCGVRFGYDDGPDVVSAVDLTVPPGRTLALVGTSGAGKTTLAKLVAGIHPPREGTVRVGRRTHAELGPAGTRRTVTLLSQEVHVFAGPLAEDLRLAAPEATADDLLEALEVVGAARWAGALPQGLETVVGDGGHVLTAVEAQELALARLVLSGTPVVVLDEATAEAGSAGARRLEDAARRATRGRTALVVAHRLTQAAQADVVAVMDRGRIVEHGPHEALIRADGPYARLWRAWSADRALPR